jgi:hypothetical protein
MKQQKEQKEELEKTFSNADMMADLEKAANDDAPESEQS